MTPLTPHRTQQWVNRDPAASQESTAGISGRGRRGYRAVSRPILWERIADEAAAYGGKATASATASRSARWAGSRKPRLMASSAALAYASR